jgi:enoyl-CoA hydratase/carnithine racemase
LSSSSGPGEAGSGAGRLIVDEPDAFTQTMPALDARCVMITGEGTIFSAGYDIGDLPDSVFADEAERLVAHPFAAAIDAIEAYPYPTLAVMNGHAIGGGLELALSCDLRIADSAIRLGMPPAKLGLVYSHTGIRKFIDVIGAARTRELFLVGRRIDAHTAQLWGLVNEVADEERLAEQALGLAHEIAANAPLAQSGNKRVIGAVLAAEGELDPTTERELIELRRACFASEDFREGVRAFAEKRPPRWQGR